MTVERVDVPAVARAHKLAFEEAARRIRYGFLAHVAGQVGATKVAVGHNADDQAETVLMHFCAAQDRRASGGCVPPPRSQSTVSWNRDLRFSSPCPPNVDPSASGYTPEAD